MIDIKNLHFRYSRGKTIYRNLTLHLEPGRIYGLLGKNGAGKSTLLKNLIGLLFPSEGTISVNGHTPGKRLPSFLQTIYFIPEEVYVPALTIRKYLDLFAGFYSTFDEQAFFRYLDHLDVRDEGKLSKLSFGQQKKFVIAFALACNTSILLLDEPTNGLDIPSKILFRKLLASVMNEGRMIFISTHQIRDLDNLIDNVIIVDQGQLLISAAIQDIANRLCFKNIQVGAAPDNVLYAEESLQGNSVIMLNDRNEDTQVDIERFFNAVTVNPEIVKLFNNN